MRRPLGTPPLPSPPSPLGASDALLSALGARTSYLLLADTGTDFAWAWNAPLMQFGGRGGLLITSGRCVGTTVLGVILAALLRHYRPALSLFGKALWQLVLGVTLSASGLIYALLTALIWPQRRLPALQPSDAAAASTQAESDGSA